MKEITFVSGGTGQTSHMAAKEVLSIARTQRVGGEVNTLYYINEDGYLLSFSFLDSDIIRIMEEK